MNRLTISLAAILAAACGSSEEPRFEPIEPSSSNSGAAQEQQQEQEAPGAAEAPAAEAPADDTPMSIEAPADVAAAPESAEKTASGLASRVLRPGTGTAHPGPTDRVTVHYVGWTLDGQRFDSSIERGQPATFPLNGVIAGWTEGVQLMVEGERRRFWIPAELAYGETPSRPGAPAGMLVFDIELIRIGG